MTSKAFVARLVFSEPVTGLSPMDFRTEKATVTEVSGSGSNYTARVTPTSDGTFSVRVLPRAVQDAAGNGNQVSKSAEGLYDATSPMLLISRVPELTNGPFIAMFKFSEPVNGFSAGDIVVEDGSVTRFVEVLEGYTATIQPVGEGDFTVSVGANAARDADGNGSLAASATGRLDTTPPTVTISGIPAISNADSSSVTFTFSEPPAGFDIRDLIVRNASISDFEGSGMVYTVMMTPSKDGVYSVQVPRNAAHDAAGNGVVGATASGQYDITRPTAEVFILDTTLPTYDLALEFSEPVTGLQESDIQASFSLLNFAGSGAEYTFEV